MFLTGLAIMIPIVLLVGFPDLAPSREQGHQNELNAASCWPGSSVMVSLLVRCHTAFATDLGASRLRFKTVSLARSPYYIIAIINAIYSPYMLNSPETHLKGKAAYPAVFFSVGLFIWVWSACPKPKM